MRRDLRLIARIAGLGLALALPVAHAQPAVPTSVDRTALPFGSAASPGRAGLVDEHSGGTGANEPAGGAGSQAPRGSDLLTRQLDDEAEVIERALATVTEKLAAADTTRVHRLGAAYRALRRSPGDDAMAVARRRAAARLLLERDTGERALLVDEADRLRTARQRTIDDAAALAKLAFPGELVRPAPGKIVRRFGTLVHERSKATLSRRGIDIEVDERSPVIAPAAGTVRYAGPIRGLDQGVILDHGTYITVLAKLADLALPVGAQIAAGDRVGRALRRRVYLEVRIKLGPGGLPIDPEPLLPKPH